MKLRGEGRQRGGLSRGLRERRAKLYIIRRCIHLQISMVDTFSVAKIDTINKLLKVSPGISFTKFPTMNLRNLKLPILN
ncbi:hypothetical protein ACMD2_07184 [Ananas comosus]|uniref:Uncharacterized protein n=1 Tax=Ananas comosus TaxID=4615 RepID=A0A199VNZ5_ANACO|nr:hypothetical protein ACMD2_07184 [Ananas comosus]